MKPPPPIPLDIDLYTPRHSDTDIAASTADPPSANICLQYHKNKRDIS